MTFRVSDFGKEGSASLYALIFLVVIVVVGGFALHDWDSDGLRNYQEWTGPTDWGNPDTDGDGLLDGEEVKQYGSDPVSVDSSGDRINDKKAVSLNLDPTREYPLINRAIEKQFSKNVTQSLTNLNNFDLNSKNTAFLEELSRLPKEERFPFSDSITKDGKIDFREKQQIKYLFEFPQEKHSELVEKELIYELNIDSDFGSNWFESNISKTNPFSPNERYALLVDSHQDWGKIDELSEFLTDIGLPENHIMELRGENATYEGFSSVLDRIKSFDQENDYLFMSLQSHGGSRALYLNDHRLSYSDLDKLLGNLDSQIVLINESCYSGASLSPLSQEDRVIISQVKENQFSTEDFLSTVLIDSFDNPKADANGNSYVSVGEAFDYGEERLGPLYGENQTYYRDPQISNISLADNLYMTQHFVNS